MKPSHLDRVLKSGGTDGAVALIAVGIVNAVLSLAGIVLPVEIYVLLVLWGAMLLAIVQGAP